MEAVWPKARKPPITPNFDTVPFFCPPTVCGGGENSFAADAAETAYTLQLGSTEFRCHRRVAPSPQGILMFILGISCFYHDAAAVLLQDGILIAAAEEERFTRKKHDYNFPEMRSNFALRKRGSTEKT
jgi:carbamoyltransferase-like protein